MGCSAPLATLVLHEWCYIRLIFCLKTSTHTHVHYSASEQEVCSEGPCSAVTAMHCCTPLCSERRCGDSKRKQFAPYIHSLGEVRSPNCPQVMSDMHRSSDIVLDFSGGPACVAPQSRHSQYNQYNLRRMSEYTWDLAPTLPCCFWKGPLEGEFLLPWEAAFTTPCLLLCYRKRVDRQNREGRRKV